MKRFDPVAVMEWGEGYGDAEEDEHGDYVLYKDAQAEVEKLRAVIRSLLELPEAHRQLKSLRRGIGTATAQAAWLNASDAINQPNA